jgi:hypothetical protein
MISNKSSLGRSSNPGMLVDDMRGWWALETRNGCDVPTPPLARPRKPPDVCVRPQTVSLAIAVTTPCLSTFRAIIQCREPLSGSSCVAQRPRRVSANDSFWLMRALTKRRGVHLTTVIPHFQTRLRVCLMPIWCSGVI